MVLASDYVIVLAAKRYEPISTYDEKTLANDLSAMADQGAGQGLYGGDVPR